MDIALLEPRDEVFFAPLRDMLSRITVRGKTSTSNRRGFPAKHRAITFGITRGRFNGITGLSHYSQKYPLIYAEIMRIGRIMCDGILDFKSVHLNNNIVCPKHLDSKNVGKSVLVSFGDYTGCNIVICDDVYDAKYRPILFNGSLLEHWNTDDLVGNKHSLVYYVS